MQIEGKCREVGKSPRIREKGKGVGTAPLGDYDELMNSDLNKITQQQQRLQQQHPRLVSALTLRSCHAHLGQQEEGEAKAAAFVDCGTLNVC